MKSKRLIASVVRILVADIADKSLLLVVPALEVASCQIQKILRRRVGQDSNVFLSNVAHGFVVGTAEIRCQYDSKQLF